MVSGWIKTYKPDLLYKNDVASSDKSVFVESICLTNEFARIKKSKIWGRVLSNVSFGMKKLKSAERHQGIMKKFDIVKNMF